MSRYYSTQRPVSLGTFPSGHKVKEIFNFDERTYVESIGRRAWGWIEFEDELTEKEARNYELVKAAEQEEHTMTQLDRDEFNHALDDFLCRHPETEGMDIISVQCDSFWYAVGELDGECYLLAESEDGISMDKMED